MLLPIKRLPEQVHQLGVRHLTRAQGGALVLLLCTAINWHSVQLCHTWYKKARNESNDGTILVHLRTAGISKSEDLVLMIVAASRQRGIRQLVWASV